MSDLLAESLRQAARRSRRLNDRCREREQRGANEVVRHGRVVDPALEDQAFDQGGDDGRDMLHREWRAKLQPRRLQDLLIERHEVFVELAVELGERFPSLLVRRVLAPKTHLDEEDGVALDRVERPLRRLRQNLVESRALGDQPTYPLLDSGEVLVALLA